MCVYIYSLELGGFNVWSARESVRRKQGRFQERKRECGKREEKVRLDAWDTLEDKKFPRSCRLIFSFVFYFVCLHNFRCSDFFNDKQRNEPSSFVWTCETFPQNLPFFSLTLSCGLENADLWGFLGKVGLVGGPAKATFPRLSLQRFDYRILCCFHN